MHTTHGPTPHHPTIPESTDPAVVDLADDSTTADSTSGSTADSPDSRWWIAASDAADAKRFAAWVHDRAAVHNRHVVPVTAVARDGAGHLLARTDPPAGTPLRETLDRIGALTPGVAVTLGVPLLELAVLVDSGALLIGSVGADDLLVDDAGAVVVVDRPPGARPLGTAPGGAPVGDAVDALVVAARVVWDGVDAREACRADVDAALGLARDGGPALTVALRTVRAAANPRPVQWDPPPALLDFTTPPVRAPTDGSGGVKQLLRAVVETGVPLPGGRRLGLRRAVVALAVAVGVVVAAGIALDAS